VFLTSGRRYHAQEVRAGWKEAGSQRTAAACPSAIDGKEEAVKVNNEEDLWNGNAHGQRLDIVVKRSMSHARFGGVGASTAKGLVRDVFNMHTKLPLVSKPIWSRSIN